MKKNLPGLGLFLFITVAACGGGNGGSTNTANSVFTVKYSFLSPDDPVGDMAWDGSHLVIASAASRRFFMVDTSGNVKDSSWSFGGYPAGIAYESEYTWFLDDVGYLYQADANRNIKQKKRLGSSATDEWTGYSEMTTTPAHLWILYYDYKKSLKHEVHNYILYPRVDFWGSFQTPTQNPSGIAWDGSSFWIGDWKEKKLYKVDDHGAVLKTYNISWKPRALAWGGGLLWLADGDSSFIYGLSVPNDSNQ